MGKPSSTNRARRSETVEIEETAGESQSLTIARLRLNPMMRHATVANAMAAATVKFDGEAVSTLDASGALSDIANQVKTGDLGSVSDYLLAQSVMLDATVTEMMRRAWQNAGEYPEAFSRYMTLALKAQTQSRTTLEALARLHQPREQVVRHVHVYEGGQAVVAEEFHHHGRGIENAGSDHQPHAARARRAGERAALPGADAVGNSVPLPAGSGAEPVPHARRGKGERRAAGKSERAQARIADS
nr:hypothetical protein [Sphingomonas glacialis]